MKQGYPFDEPYFDNLAVSFIQVFRHHSIPYIDISSSLWYLLAQLNYGYA